MKVVQNFFFNFKGSLAFYRNIKDYYKTLQKAEENQKKFKSDIYETKTFDQINNLNKIYDLVLNLADKINLKISDKYVALSNLRIYNTWEIFKKSEKNNKYKTSAPTWRDKFELPGRSYSVSDIQDYFEYTLKKHGEKNGNSSIRKYISKIENRITFEIKTKYYLKLLTPETTKLPETTKSKLAKSKDENGQNVPNFEI